MDALFQSQFVSESPKSLQTPFSDSVWKELKHFNVVMHLFFPTSSSVLFSHRQWGKDSVSAVVQLVVRHGRVQVRGLLHRLRRETKLTLFIQSPQLTPTTTEQTTNKPQTTDWPDDHHSICIRYEVRVTDCVDLSLDYKPDCWCGLSAGYSSAAHRFSFPNSSSSQANASFVLNSSSPHYHHHLQTVRLFLKKLEYFRGHLHVPELHPTPVVLTQLHYIT